MGFRNRVAAFFGVPTARFSEPPPRPIDKLILEMSGRSDSPRIGRVQALSVPAVLRGRNLICSIATLPLVQYDGDNTPVRNPLFEQIDPDVPNVVTLAQTIEDLLFEGIAWWRISGFGWDGYPVNARRLDPLRVTLDEDGTVWVDGKRVPATELIRFYSPNPGLLSSAGRPIKRALLLEQLAAMYADNPRPLDYFTPTEGADPADDDDIKDVLAKWRKARKEGSTAYVPAALKYNAADQPTPADLQLVELQRQATLDIANALGLDPEDLGQSTTSRTYQNATDRRQDRINDTLSPYMRAVTDRLSMGDVTKRGHQVRFDVDDYMRADPRTRWDVYEKAKNMGAITVPEIRAEEKMPALDPAELPQPAPAPAPAEVSATGPARLVLSRESGLTFDDVPASTFAVDEDSRTITGLAVPYGQVARSGGRQWRFAAGSIRWSAEKRVKLLRDHDHAQAIGYATKLTETPQGLVATFKVARGPRGDEALALAADGVLDGLSIGVDFTDDAFTKDPDNAATWLVKRAALREVSLTAMPAFDDSRLTSVVASREGGSNMPCATCGQVHAEGVACTASTTPAATAPDTGPATFTMEQVLQLMQAQGQPQAPAQPEGRQVVNPTPGGAVFVDEPTPYTFDAKGHLQKGTHDFSTDLIAGSKGDAAALARAETFMREQFAVTQTNVSSLNPTRQRPDMYVDQREYRYPVWEAISKGSLSDNTPFTFPKFSSSSGLVANHTEGTEPTPGAFTATSQTVTPSAVSGKIEITRETWDQGGNPQVSNLIWRQMTRAWYEALEAAAVKVLDDATPTAIALTAGGGTTGQALAAELKAAFAALQFIRGGFSMDTAFSQIDLYKALAGAKDNDGRPLFPILGPTNADGSTRSRLGAIDVDGVQFLPAWALAATGSVVASSYLFDREVVHGWASAPQRLDFQYRVAYVDLAIWGYKATAISDINGVREITYDPVP
ncbi:HK97 family phage prohead protease [Micromonospora sp. NPDC050686]|uniref:HK97 family phage prohead protease n=1 Tax=Micromonospora sp. NPDC050686 TaxID=3154631 RepID=UPI0033E1076C